MKITADWKVNIKVPEVLDKVSGSGTKAMKAVVTEIANDAIKDSPVLTGNNRRSIMFEVGPNGEVAKTDKEGAVYSTSGYGGILETGSVKMPARPYFKPALDRNIGHLVEYIKSGLK